jgi:hypothetical protein
LLVVEGLRPADTFNHRIEYGHLWHVCEAAWAGSGNPNGTPWTSALNDYASKLCRKYPLQQEQVVHWTNVCERQFPVYVTYWRKHPDVKNCTPLMQERVFDVPYKLPSGRVARLRGKWDGVEQIGKGRSARIYLPEHKTKGDVNEAQLRNQLRFDLQTMFYFIALGGSGILANDATLAGVRYNVVRRPLSGGKNSIRQTQKETPAEFYARLAGLITAEPEWYFMRWLVEITKADVDRFKHEFLDPCLEQLCDWWEWIAAAPDDPWRCCPSGLHYRLPHGIYNVLAEGGSSELDEYLATGSELGLERTDRLFKELEND